jgi:3-oxoacyl-[acyl-carrier-protein] synthase-3
MRSVGIHGIGIYLPPEVRRNDWWSPEVVEEWRRRSQRNLARPELEAGEPDDEGARLVLAAMAGVRDDPFKGAVERRVMPSTMVSSDMEIAAGRQALQQSGVSPGEVDLLLVYSQLPDYLVIPTATRVHHQLGLGERCLSMGTEGACNSFLQQLTLAEALIQTGRARYALLIQSSAVSRICRKEDHHSVWFGDGATAVVVGEVSAGRGILGTAHCTDGSFYRALVGGVPGSRWYLGGAPHPVLYVEDRAEARRMLLRTADLARQSIHEALAASGHRPEDVDFYATHQSTAWFRETTQQYAGLSRARSHDTFAWTGSLGASNIPIMMALAEREGQLHEGHLVAMHTGGSGITWSGMVLRYGR